jgi:murein DD-endopeptidase MepM/ murein hydrolase activator NlpD
MIRPFRRRTHHNPFPFYGALALLLVTLVLAVSWTRPDESPPEPPMLPAVYAIGGRVDTLFLGGYTRGSFAEAVRILDSDLSESERGMIGRHLDKMFAPVLKEKGLSDTGRLRLAYERTQRPDGTTRAIRVLAAEAAVGGSMHTAFFYEQDKRPGYFDGLGRSLTPQGMTRPLDRAWISSPFNSHRMHPILRRIMPHNGVDYAATAGTPVRATADGSVSWAQPRGGYGNAVEIQHPNGYATRSAHLSGFASGVRQGAAVQQGEVVGFVGSTGLSTGPHLHYEVRRQGQPVNPEAVAMEAGPAVDVGYAPEWRSERQRLAQLLARAPTMLRARDQTAMGDR